MPKRRPRGTGTIFYSRPRKRWIGRKPVGRTPAGRTRYVECWGRTQEELVRRLDAAGPPGPDVTVSGWTERWLDTLTVGRPTADNYRTSVGHVAGRVGHLKLSALTTHDVEGLSAHLLRAGLEANTVRKVLKHLSVCLNAAVRAGVVPANVVRPARKPKSKRAKIDPFTPDELTLIVRSCDRPRLYPVALLAATGCRVGESLGLNAADYTAGTLSVTKTYCRRYGLRPPKTPNSVRTIRVPLEARPAVLAALGSRKTGPLFATSRGRRRPPQDTTGAWRALLKRLGLRYRNLHQLRHAVASAMLARGASVPNVAKYLGDTPAEVGRTYAHATGEDMADVMDSVLGGGRKVGTGDGMSQKRGKLRA